MAANHMIADAAPQSRTFDTLEQLSQHAADWIVERTLASQKRFAICLSGGSTPKRLYELLATPPRCERLPWARTHWFWGDERAVPQCDPRSNFRMVAEAMLWRAPAPKANIHPIPTAPMSLNECAAQYAATLKRFYGAEKLIGDRPLFDLTLLGLGEDGHIASLFPGSPALAEASRWVLPVVGETLLNRITLTFPPLASSRTVVFLVVGKNKRDALARARSGDQALPSARLHPVGPVHWFMDRAASTLLGSSSACGQVTEERPRQ